jgi:hypothetical protein
VVYVNNQYEYIGEISKVGNHAETDQKELAESLKELQNSFDHLANKIGVLEGHK